MGFQDACQFFVGCVLSLRVIRYGWAVSVLASGLTGSNENPSFWVAVPESLAIPEINRPPWWGSGAAELLGEEKKQE